MIRQLEVDGMETAANEMIRVKMKRLWQDGWRSRIKKEEEMEKWEKKQSEKLKEM